MGEIEKKEERKIIRIGEKKYQVLKPREDGEGWQSPGECKGIEEIVCMFESGKFALTKEESLFYEIKAYQKQFKQVRR